MLVEDIDYMMKVIVVGDGRVSFYLYTRLAKLA